MLFGLRKGSGIHRKGFRMFPEMFGYANTLFGPKRKSHKVFGKRKRKVCGVQGPDARVSGVWPPGLRKTPFAPTYSPVGLTPWPNHIIQYMNLYLRTMPELLVMSVISSGTPNNIRSPTYITHIILYRQRMLSVRTLRVQ